MTRRLIGVDEAGRGPVIGPMVICALAIDESQNQELIELGIKDSKAFGSSKRAKKRRAELAKQIKENFEYALVSIDAKEIDRWKDLGGINKMEQHYAAEIIDQLHQAERIIADGKNLFSPLKHRYRQLEALDKADAAEPVVAAASIIAKAERDRRFDEIVAEYATIFGEVGGGGYPNKKTEAFIRHYAQTYKRLPNEVRKTWSWKALKEIELLLEEDSQKQNTPQLTLDVH